MRRFEHKTVLVSGASSGIGFATALRLAAEGARVIGMARNKARLEQAMAQWEQPERHQMLVLDSRDEAALEEATASMRKSGTALDGAAVCAGQHALRPLQVAKAGWMNDLLAGNLTASLLCSKLFQRCASPEGGSVVWVSSVAALTGGAGEAVYAAAKGALISACRSVAVEFAPRRIRVNVLAPGVVETPMSQAWLAALNEEQLSTVKKRHLFGFGAPADAAAAIAFLLSDDARWITGTTLVADGGFSCH